MTWGKIHMFICLCNVVKIEDQVEHQKQGIKTTLDLARIWNLIKEKCLQGGSDTCLCSEGQSTDQSL